MAPALSGPGSLAGPPRDETRRQLQALIRRLEARRPRSPSSAARAPRPSRSALAGVVRRTTDAGACSYRELRLPLDACVGRQSLAPLGALGGDVLEFLAPDEDLAGAAPADLLFLDIETTGLGGAGAMAFLVATARVEAGAFVLRQYLALSPEEEAAVLAALLEDARPDDDPVLVTYNGRGFDAPMLDGRMTMHRRRGRFESLRHLDLLAVSRVLYRGLLGSCRLAAVEVEMLGVTRQSEHLPEEVPGAEVPAWYFRFLRTGDGRYLDPIVRHNEVDVMALGGLLARLGDLATGAAAPRHPAEALAFARLLARRGRGDEAAAWLREAIDGLAPSFARDESLLRLAALHKRAGRRDLAEPLWRELAASPGSARLHAQVELAKSSEHERRDYARAADAVDAALDGVRRSAPDAVRWRAALAHRRARVMRKQGLAVPMSTGGVPAPAHRPYGG